MKNFTLKQIAYLYVSIPMFLFILLWLSPAIGVPLAIVYGFVWIRSFGFKDSESLSINEAIGGIPKNTLWGIMIIAFGWCYLAGQGGFFYQSSDHFARNAIYRDLIFNSWPVVKDNVLLNYYIGHWLFPALLSKPFYLISGSTTVGWLFGRVLLLFWSTLGISIVLALVLNTFGYKKLNKYGLGVILGFIFFSGMDMLGIYIIDAPVTSHLEWWSGSWQFSSFTTCLFWVFNQTIITWIVVLLFLNERQIQNYGWCAAILLINGPIPCVGIVLFYFVDIVWSLIHKRNLKNLFSLQNLYGVIVILPIVYLYYSSNCAVNTGLDSGKTFYFLKEHATLKHFIKELLCLVVFYIAEFMIYALLCWKREKHNPLYYCMWFMLLTCPFIHIGTGSDYVMRASIPSLVILYVMFYKAFIESYETKKILLSYIMSICILVGALTPVKEYYRAFSSCVKHHKIILPCETIWSIFDVETYGNFHSVDFKNSSFNKILCHK